MALIKAIHTEVKGAYGSRPDYITTSEPTDQDLVSAGCGTLFLNYLAYQLNIPWPKIIAAMSPTLAETAQKLNPCGAIQAELQDISPGDFINFQAYEKARAGLMREVIQCERSNPNAMRLQNPFAPFNALLAYHYPLGAKIFLETDNPFPLAWPPA